MQESITITNNDTVPFTNRFNYVVKELSFQEFLQHLSQIEAEAERENEDDPILSPMGCFQ